jgi:hypothetical protein
VRVDLPAPRARGSDRIPVPPPAEAPRPPAGRWGWPLASSLAAIAIAVVAGALSLRGCTQEVAAPPAAGPAAAPPSGTPAEPERLECAAGALALEPVELPTGEVVYRLQPI